MTFGSSETGTGMDNSIPEGQEREGNEKKHSQNSGMGRKWKQIHSHISGTRIRGYHSLEYPGTGTGMKKNIMWLVKKYLSNMWREKEFWPKHPQPHLPPFLIIPPLLVVVTATINEQKSKQNYLIHYLVVLKALHFYLQQNWSKCPFYSDTHF